MKSMHRSQFQNCTQVTSSWGLIIARTNPNAATTGRAKGTGSISTRGGTPGTFLRYRTSGLCRPFLRPDDLLQMIRPVFRHHPHVVANSDPVSEFRMACGFLQVRCFQPPQQPIIGVAVEPVECDQLPGAAIPDIPDSSPKRPDQSARSPGPCQQAFAACGMHTGFPYQPDVQASPRNTICPGRVCSAASSPVGPALRRKFLLGSSRRCREIVLGLEAEAKASFECLAEICEDEQNTPLPAISDETTVLDRSGRQCWQK
jgi:hypothetical protein